MRETREQSNAVCLSYTIRVNGFHFTAENGAVRIGHFSFDLGEFRDGEFIWNSNVEGYDMSFMRYYSLLSLSHWRDGQS